jgi:hypothetical protein
MWKKSLKQQSRSENYYTRKQIDHSKWLLNAKVELNRIVAEYNEKVAKAESDQFTALSNQWYRSSSKQIKKSVCKL